MRYGKLLLISAIFLSGSIDTIAQKPMTDLAFYADVMANASDAGHRLRAQDSFSAAFLTLLKSDTSTTMTLDELQWITQVVSQDSVLRLFTWQVPVSEDDYRYFGVLQSLTNNWEPVVLHDKRSLRSEYGTHSPDSWYGAVYYGIQTFTMVDSSTAYLLLGFQANNAKTNQRVADILVVQSGKITFGAEVFIPDENADDKQPRSRIIHEYADAASGIMKFDREQQILVYDHVITIFTEGPDAGPLLVPDGSYHAYKYREGLWHFTDKLFNVKLDEPPRSRPEQQEDRDILGRPKKNQ